jgi:histidinol-phosphate phosphatase family protein
MNSSPFIFLDRDGTVIEEKNYLSNPNEVVLCPKALEGLIAFQDQGARLVLITNQSGLSRGYFSQAQLDSVHDRLKSILKEGGVTLEGIYFCPHQPSDNCACRKPSPYMLHQAVAELGGSLEGAVMIGDKLCDVEMAHGAGIRSILVQTGYGQHYPSDGIQPNFFATDLSDAALMYSQYTNPSLANEQTPHCCSKNPDTL